MKIRFTILVLSLITSLATQAQYIALQAGWAIPSGSFGNSDYGNPEDGFATNGGTVSIFTNYLMTKRLGICAHFNYAEFGFNHKSISEQANKQAPPLTQVAASSNQDYSASSAMAGVSYTLGNGNLTFDARVMTGFLTLRSPSITFTTTTNGQHYSHTFDTQHDMSLAFGFGIGAKYALPKNWFVVVNIDNTVASMEFPKNGYQSSAQTTVTKPYQAYMLTAGVGYRIQQ